MLTALCIVDVLRKEADGKPLHRGYARLLVGCNTVAEAITPWHEDEAFALCDLMNTMFAEFGMTWDTVRWLVERYRAGEEPVELEVWVLRKREHADDDPHAKGDT